MGGHFILLKLDVGMVIHKGFSVFAGGEDTSWLLCLKRGDGVVLSKHAVVVRPNACKAKQEDWVVILQFSNIEALAYPV